MLERPRRRQRLVVSSNGTLTGAGVGIERQRWLLSHEAAARSGQLLSSSGRQALGHQLWGTRTKFCPLLLFQVRLPDESST